MAIVIHACHKEESTLELESSASENEMTQEQVIFFSNKKTNQLLSPTAHAWNPNEATNRSEDALNAVKVFIQNFDTELSDKYVHHIINTAGYPLWDARHEIQVEHDVLVFIPIFQETSTEISAIIACSGTYAGEVAYTVMYRKEMQAELVVGEDPNFSFYTQLFAYFDKELFGKSVSAYEEWGDAAMRDVPDVACGYVKVCEQIIDVSGLESALSCYLVCTYECSNELMASGVVDTPSELAWVSGNCVMANIVDEFLEDNNADNPAILEAAQILLEIGMSEIFGLQDFEDFSKYFAQS